MSESEGKKLVDETLNAFGELKTRLNDIESKSASPEDVQAHKLAIADINSKMSEMEAKQLEIAKQLEVEKVQAKQLSEIDKDEAKRAQIIEFGRKFIEVAKGQYKEFNSLDLKSLKDYEAKAAAQFNSLSDPDGGLAVISEIDRMFESLVREFSNVRPWCSNVSIKGDTWKRPFLNKTNGALREKDISSFTAATKTDTLSQITITVSRLFSIIPIDKDLIADDMIGFVAELMRSAVEDFVITEGEEFVNGDGKSEWSGIKNTTDGTAYNEIERYTTAASAGAGAIVIEDFINLMGKLKTAHTKNAALYMPREIMTIARLLRSDSGAGAGTGDLMWQPSVILGQPSMLLGAPVRELAELDTAETVAGNIVCAYGDLRGYMVVDRKGVEVQENPYISYPATVMQLCKRSGGGLVNGEKIKLLKMKA
jgi:HK97 family phage major capsid protein